MIKQETIKDERRKSLQTLSHKYQVNNGIVNNCTFLGAEGPALVITGDKVRLFFFEDIISSYRRNHIKVGTCKSFY